MKFLGPKICLTVILPVILTPAAIVEAASELSVAAAQPVVAPILSRIRHLRSLVIDVKGRAQWRPAADKPWRDARVNDLLPVGAEIRTGFNSSMGLRVGRNATVLVNRSTVLSLPVMLRDGDTLTTRAGIRRGKAEFKVDDIKVDDIQMTNDFQVLTPTTTLSVRGTGFAVRWGGLKGAEIEALSANVFAIEVKYLATQFRYLLREGGVTRDARPDPVLVALFNTFQTPMLSLTEAEYTTEMSNTGTFQGLVVREGRRVDQGFTSTEITEQMINKLSPEVQLICNNHTEFFGAYKDGLAGKLGFNSFDQLSAFNDMAADVATFCFNLEGFEGDPFDVIIAQVEAFCQTYDTMTEIEHCESLFHDLIDDALGGHP